MNQGRIWCVVNPTVGLPLFLGSVALMSFTVHYAVLNNSTWMKGFFNGVPLKQATVETTVAPVAKSTAPAKSQATTEVSQLKATTSNGSESFTVKITPKAKSSGQVLPVPG